MNKQILLPNNCFGLAIMLLLLILLAVVPFVVSFWLISLIAPIWVVIPLSLLITIVCFVKFVKFNK